MYIGCLVSSSVNHLFIFLFVSTELCFFFFLRKKESLMESLMQAALYMNPLLVLRKVYDFSQSMPFCGVLCVK